jgi:hypothetical protein
MPEPQEFLTRTYGPKRKEPTVAEVKRKLKRGELARGELLPAPHERGAGQLKFLLGLRKGL